MPKAKKKLAAAVTLGRLGGKARAERLSAERRSEIASKAGQSRTKKLSKEERRTVAKLAAEARWQKRRSKPSAK